MTSKYVVRIASTLTSIGALALAGALFTSRHLHASSDDNGSDASRIRRGFEIAPVPLNLEGKNRALVGLGSYIVNAVADCNGCHSAGPPTEFTRNCNPYQLSPPF